MRYQLLVLEALPRGAALEALAGALPRCVSSCAMELCRMEPFPGPMVVGVSDDEAEIREACARLEAARCTVCVVDRGAHIRDLVERVTRRSVRPAPPEAPDPTSAKWHRAGPAVALLAAVALVAGAGLSRRSSRPAGVAPVPAQAAEVVAVGADGGRAPEAVARGPLGQWLARMAEQPVEGSPSPTRTYGAWMQQFRARSGVASSPMPSPSGVEGSPSPGATPRRRPRRRVRSSSPLVQQPVASGAQRFA